MNIDYILYYLLNLIRKGQEWQRKDLNGSDLDLKYSSLKLGAACIAGIFVWKNPLGLYEQPGIADCMLSSLSITTALLFSIIVVVLDRARSTTFNSEDEEGQVNDIHQWNHLYQFASLVGNAILWSLLVIVILISTMLFGHKVDLGELTWCGWDKMWQLQSLYLFGKYAFVAGTRFVLIYALFNFFILFLFALLSLFESICSELDIKRPQNIIIAGRRESVSQAVNRSFGRYTKFFIKLLAIGLFVIAIIYAI